MENGAAVPGALMGHSSPYGPITGENWPTFAWGLMGGQKWASPYLPYNNPSQPIWASFAAHLATIHGTSGHHSSPFGHHSSPLGRHCSCDLLLQPHPADFHELPHVSLHNANHCTIAGAISWIETMQPYGEILLLHFQGMWALGRCAGSGVCVCVCVCVCGGGGRRRAVWGTERQ